MARLSLIFCPESWVQTGYKVEMSHATSTAVLCVLADCTLAQLPQEPVFPTLVPVWLLQLLNSTVKDPWEAQLLFFCLSICKCTNPFISRLSPQMSRTARRFYMSQPKPLKTSPRQYLVCDAVTWLCNWLRDKGEAPASASRR